MRSRIAYCQVLWQRRNYTHTKAATLYLLHTSNSQIRFLLNSISKFFYASLLACKEVPFYGTEATIFIG